MNLEEHKNRRILLIDDNRAIHEDFMTILEKPEAPSQALADAETAIFGASEPQAERKQFEIDSAYQGQEGLEKIRLAVEQKRPYAMAFVDVRMPPGWDGIETIHKIWEEYPQLQVVICTAYSDYDWKSIVDKLGRNDQLLILKKPFDNIEVYQLASAMTEKWNYARLANARKEELESAVAEKTRQLSDANKRLTSALHDMSAVNEQLNILAAKAMAANRAKSEFLSNMSHELKTPMNAIMGFAELLKNQCQSGLQKDYAEIIYQSGGDLLRMIDNVLDYSEVMSEHFEPQIADCRLEEVLEHVDAVMRPAAMGKGLAFEIVTEYGLPINIHTDANRLKQCLNNLIDNAIKFTHQGHVRVKVFPLRDNCTRLCFEVEDTGIGIAPEKQQDVFTAFTQADNSTTRAYSGAGLGLAITNQLAEFLGGKLLFESTPGRGSTFTLIIPVVPEITGNGIRIDD